MGGWVGGRVGVVPLNGWVCFANIIQRVARVLCTKLCLCFVL